MACATSGNGCKVIDSVYVETTANTLLVPNAFTPNGDGLNDYFQIAQINVATINMKVFNRWGQLVFIGTDVMKGWDGRFNGKPEQNGVYVYQVYVTYLDGSTETRKGNVTLLR